MIFSSFHSTPISIVMTTLYMSDSVYIVKVLYLVLQLVINVDIKHVGDGQVGDKMRLDGG